VEKLQQTVCASASAQVTGEFYNMAVGIEIGLSAAH